MKIFLLSPNVKTFFSSEQLKRLQETADLVIEQKIKPFEQVSGLISGEEERILAIDPDFCDWKVPNEVIEKIPHLKAIVLQTTSFSWLDVEFAKGKGIPVVNLRGFSTIAVAEWAVLMMLNLARKLPLVIKDGWKQDYVKHQGLELRGKVAGIVGLGSIGTAIAEHCRGLGMTVQYWSRHSKDDRFKQVELAELMKTSDVIFPAVAQNEETQGLITDDMLKSMKKSSIFVSIVHNVYSHDLLLEMAQKGEIYGYGFETNKIEFGAYEGNVWAGSELAWCTEDSMRKNTKMWVEAITKAAVGNYETRVN
ncbi:MAG: D-isomer specific 2-hydroxyacid dehydrogenase NAD-binding protein [uncultured bacterium]|nr:MAG: D-isomer specific 2-hydroxyacid dehydrogenase NAD-binding protein [uncultured bacterium]